MRNAREDSEGESEMPRLLSVLQRKNLVPRRTWETDSAGNSHFGTSKIGKLLPAAAQNG
jgi:hypothetical protein